MRFSASTGWTGSARGSVTPGDQATASFTLPFRHDDAAAFLNELINVCVQLREHLNDQRKLLQNSM